MAPFGLSERLVRTSVFRLARDGWIAGETQGRRSRYRLTADGARRFAQAHQRIYAPADTHWNGEWEMVLAPPDAAPPARRRALRDELAWEGFAALARGAFARPAHGDSTAREIVAALALARSVMVLRVRDDPNAPRHAGGARRQRVAAARARRRLPPPHRALRHGDRPFPGVAADARRRTVLRRAVPVCADAMTSRPSSSTGIVCAWIGAGSA